MVRNAYGYMFFDTKRHWFLFRNVLSLIGIVFLCLSCSLQSQERVLVHNSPTLKEEIIKTLDGPVTRFPLKADEDHDYHANLYADPRTRSSLIRFYARISGSEKIAKAILDAAIKQNIDVTLAFALAKAESDFRPAIQSRNSDNSVDMGLFQLNSRTFPGLSAKEASDPYINARKGLAHLRFCIDYSGDEVRALAVYNAGLSRAERGAIPASTYGYVERVLTYETEIESRFRDEVLRLWVPLSDA